MAKIRNLFVSGSRKHVARLNGDGDDDGDGYGDGDAGGDGDCVGNGNCDGDDNSVRAV
jgi:hypothetical protein